MAKLFIYKGLQASGKSKKAVEVITKDVKTRRVERDLLRTMMFGSLWNGRGADEKLVTKAQRMLIQMLLAEGINVISSDTNLNENTVKDLKAIAKQCNAQVEIDDSFLSTSVEECIIRDLARPNSVGEEVIRNFAKKYLPQTDKIIQDRNLPKAVIFDADGTLCLKSDRSPFDWKRVGEDTPNTFVVNALKNYFQQGYRIIVLSGRDGVCYQETKDWLELHTGLKFQDDFQLYMRRENDMRKDSIIKKELFMNHIYGKYFVEAVFDDRQKVVEMWTDLGLSVFRCGILFEDNF
jgi:predicted kinase